MNEKVKETTESPEETKVNFARRNFLKLSALLAADLTATAYLGGLASASSASTSSDDLLTLTQVSDQQAASLLQSEQTFVYTADSMCASECGLAVNVVNGIVSSIYGNPYVPYNSATMCAKGSSGKQLVYSPYRIQYPMIRVGERGEGKFKAVTWDEALSYIAQKLESIKQTYGPESVVFDGGDMPDRHPYWRLFFAYGTPNCTEHGAICDLPRRLGGKLLFGGMRIEPDIMRPVLVRQPDGSLKNDFSYQTKLIMYVGWNPFTSTRINYESRGTVEAKLNGAKIIVVDPAFTNTASKADIWIPIRPGTDADLLAFMLRYILENHSDTDPTRRYIDWSFLNYSVGWDEFLTAFKSWWDKTDPINGLKYFTTEWAANRTGISPAQLEEVAHLFGITKPAALVWGMNGTGHQFNGEVISVLGAVLNTITGNFDAPGGVIDTALTRCNYGGSAPGGSFNSRTITRTVNGKQVKGTQSQLWMDVYGDWMPVNLTGQYIALGDLPNKILNGVTITQGPFAGYKYPIKAYILRGGNTVITGSNTAAWQRALTAKDSQGNYVLELFVYIDSIFLESGLYADVILPEASYLERMSVSDIYPSHPMIYLRQPVIQPQFQAKNPVDIMNALARALSAAGDPDIKAADFWEKYPTEEDFWNDALTVAPGMANVGTPLPYPQYPEGYTIIGTPDSLEAGNVTIDHTKKVVQGQPLTVEWLRNHNGVAIWPMAWYRYKSTGFLRTSSGKIEFTWDYTTIIDGKPVRYGAFSRYNELIEQSGTVPSPIKALGWSKYPSTFFWFENIWNPFTNPNYTKYASQYPFQLINGRIHQTQTATQGVVWLSRITEEDLWEPLGKGGNFQAVTIGPTGPQPTGKTIQIRDGEVSIGVIQMNTVDGVALGLKTGDIVTLTNPLGSQQTGIVNLVETIRPGVLRVGIGAGGRFSPGAGSLYFYRDVTVNHNAMVDPNAFTPISGFPAYGNMIVQVKKVVTQ
jgi:anaerobic selenocysteine-containing dehydrogenase